MGDIHIKTTKEGILMWRTRRAANGARVRVKGSEVLLANKGEIVATLPIFQQERELSVSLGESNDSK